MRKLILAAAALSLSASATAQSAQERLDTRYDRALAAGYKALFLCSAIANAEANGATRTPESVHEWELSWIQQPLDGFVRDLEYDIRRRDGVVTEVRVPFADDMPPRIGAVRGGTDGGCFLKPIGASGTWASMASTAGERDDRPWREAFDKLDSETGQRIVQSAFDGSYGDGSRTTGLVIVRSGEIILEDYTEGFGPNVPQRTWSVAKSIAATVVGAKVQLGEADVNEPTELWPEIGDPRDQLTIDHFLRMASGRYQNTPGNRTDPLYWGGTTVTERAMNWPLIREPGTVWRYANNDTLMAIAAVKETLAFDTPAALFAKLGMNNTVAEQDWQGNYILSSQVWSTARDLARLGQLHLNDGEWNGERIVPEGWTAYVSDPSGPQPVSGMGYGAGWGTFRRPEGNAFEGVPDDAFAARGNRGQYVVVVPSRDVVIVRRGEDMVGTRFDIAAFTRDVLAAID